MGEAARFQQAFGALLADHAAEPIDAGLARALVVHRNTATKAALDALGDNFPVVAQLLGEEAFTAAALAFVARTPPADPRLCLYGQGFPAFLDAHPELVEMPYLAEVATIERLVVEALFAADAAAVSPAALAGGIDLDARFRLHPAVRRAAFTSPAVSIWRAHRAEAEPRQLERLAWEPETALVTRVGDEVSVQAIDAATAGFLDRLAAGAPLGDAAAWLEADLLPAAFAIALSGGVLVAA